MLRSKAGIKSKSSRKIHTAYHYIERPNKKLERNREKYFLLPKYAKQNRKKAIKLVRKRVKVAFGYASFVWSRSCLTSSVRQRQSA